jgi:hypothetical protein
MDNFIITKYCYCLSSSLGLVQKQGRNKDFIDETEQSLNTNVILICHLQVGGEGK